ncbi:MAG: hypothetical protein ACLGIA_07960 [Actinomycetes bacterium]
MGILDAVGHGTLLGRRYRLEDRLQSGPSSSYWRAVDQTLERSVGIRVVRGRFVDDTLDAARRAALVEDPRLLRVLDVGTSDVPLPDDPDDPRGADGGVAHLAYVVAEFLPAHSLATVLRDEGPVPAEHARTLVGEAAEALEHARRAGLHHRLLTPGSLLLDGDGKIKVAGLAVDAASAGVEDEDDVTAARQDAVALVAVLYAGITGRWPLDRAAAGLEPAPRVGAHPTPPAGLVSGVPADLDTICAVTLGPLDDGPRTPGELADQLTPWGPMRTDQAEHEPATSERAVRPASRFPVRLAPREPQHREQHVDVGREAPDDGAQQAQVGAEAALGAEQLRTQVLAPPADDPAAVSPGLGDGSGVPLGNGAGDSGRLSFAQAIGLEEYADPPRRSSAAQKAVMAVIAGVLVVGLALAVHSLSSLRGDVTAATLTPTPTATPSAASPAPPQQSAPAEQAPAPQPPAIASVSTLDPQGGDGENDPTAPLAIDGDPQTSWDSSTYRTADFGGLKNGVGLVVHLAQPATVSKVTLGINGTGGAFEVRAAPGAGLGGSTVVGTGTATGQPVEVALAQPVETQYLVIWFTQLPTTNNGYRVELTNVQVQ